MENTFSLSLEAYHLALLCFINSNNMYYLPNMIPTNEHEIKVLDEQTLQSHLLKLDLLFHPTYPDLLSFETTSIFLCLP